MAKVYDRVSCPYLYILMRRMAFCKRWIDIIFRHISSNCAEYLFTKLNNLFNILDFKGFSMNKRGLFINHLTFADDVILFSSGCRKFLELLLETLNNYEQVSSQEINKMNSSISISSKGHPQAAQRVVKISEMDYKELLIKYLGCPLYKGRKKASLFVEIMCKIINRIERWPNELLSIGGREILIKYILISLHINIITTLHPPMSLINEVEKMLNRFLWGGSNEKKKYHWASWEKLYYSYEEGWGGFRRLQDICKAFAMKQW
ncbi:hypothetical protein P3S67_015690 [Capsicum chacoense]